MPATKLTSSFARIKPLHADKGGGELASKTVTGFDEAGSVDVGAVAADGSGGKAKPAAVFEHFAATVTPSASQAQCHETVCAPLVAQRQKGFDVDVLCCGQTGSGKTFTTFGPPDAVATAAAVLHGGVGTRHDADGGGAADAAAPEAGILRGEHGLVLRAGFAAPAATHQLKAAGSRAMLHGSTVETSTTSLTDHAVHDLLQDRKLCFVDKAHHLQGARQVPLQSASELLQMAAAVETRLTRGTKMNDNSSRSHCATVLTLRVLDPSGGGVRTSWLQFFDLTGSERFKGADAAHDASTSSKSTTSGWEGICANLSPSSLMDTVRAAAVARRKKKKPTRTQLAVGAATELLKGSLEGSALTATATCLSQSPRNGAEPCMSLEDSAGCTKLLNAPAPQPSSPLGALPAAARKPRARSTPPAPPSWPRASRESTRPCARPRSRSGGKRFQSWKSSPQPAPRGQQRRSARRPHRRRRRRRWRRRAVASHASRNQRREGGCCLPRDDRRRCNWATQLARGAHLCVLDEHTMVDASPRRRGPCRATASPARSSPRPGRRRRPRSDWPSWRRS